MKQLPIDRALLSTNKSRFLELRKSFENAIELLHSYKRVAYSPVIEEVKMNFSTRSKSGGIPYLWHKKDWPVCPNCGTSENLFIQLNMAKLPELSQEGVVKLFYCTTVNPKC